MSELPKFISDDPSVITRELVSAYQAMTGKTLYPAHVDRIMIDLIAYRESVVRAAINDTGRQNLVAFARAPMLDYLGELVGVARLPAQGARCTVRLAFAAPLASSLLIAAGTRVETGSGVQFQSEAPLIAPAAATYADLAVMAIEPGAAANGYLPGQVNTLVDDVGVDVDTVANLGVTLGGADEESDDRLRERIRLAPESFTVAGSRLAYRFHAMSAHPRIVDVAVLGPALTLVNGRLQSLNGVPPGGVRLFPLLDSGLPDAALLALVNERCSAEKVRPLCDEVQTLAPPVRDYVVRATLTLLATADRESVLARAREAANAYVADRAAGLGRDVVPSQLMAALSLPGVYEVSLVSPASRLVVAEHEWARCGGVVLTLAAEGVDG